MREFRSLRPERVPEGFDAEIHGEEPIVKVEESKGRIVVSYAFPGFYLSDDSRDVHGKKVPFKQVNIAAAGFLAESGKPLLPSFGRYVQIPFDRGYKFTVEKGKPVQFEDLLILPAQEKLTDNPEEKQEFEYDEKMYAKDALYPEEMVKITGPFDIDDYCALLVHVCPFQYNPAKRKLIGYGNVTVSIDVSLKQGESDEYLYSDPGLNREAYGNLFVNPSRRVEERLEIEPGRIGFPPFPLRGPEFLIIYHKDFKGAAEKLEKWKNMRGLRTDSVSIITVGNTVAKIKAYIRNRRKYIFSRLRYVLLFGDVEMIKPETIPGGPYGSNVTDHYYATKTDSTGPTNYVMPWLSIGRIPVRTKDEAAAVVDQIISYEKNPPCDPEYFGRMAFAAYFQGDGTANRAYMKTMEDIREHMIALGFDVERIYVSQTSNVQYYLDGTPVPLEVKNSIVDGDTATKMLISTTAEGQLITGHRNHGGSSGWSHPAFTTSDLEAITSEYPTIFYSINCLTGEFDLTAPTESFAEKILRIKGGAPSLVAATRSSHTWLNNDLMRAMFDAMWAGVLPTFPSSTASYPVKYNRLGDILNYGKSYLPVQMSGSSEYIKDHYEIYHVIGDPTIELWKALPITISIQASIIGNYLSIKLSPSPKGSVITVWYKDKMLKRVEPSSNHVKISLRDILPSPLPPMKRLISVCFWSPGYRFRQVIVRV